MGHLFYLFARPSFRSGMATILDIGGNNINYSISATPAEADKNALKSDWFVVGRDLFNAITEEKRRVDVEKETE